jgi:hypothetical protein
MPKATKNFNYKNNYKKLNLRTHPELYRIGKGLQGVLLVEPYKSEILPHWRFKTPPIAKKSAKKIYEIFLDYKTKKDFVGMDMARKFLQMGITRSLRYYHHKTGKKYIGPVPKNKKGQSGAHGRKIAPNELDLEKKVCAEIFRKNYTLVLKDATYITLRDKFKKKYG